MAWGIYQVEHIVLPVAVVVHLDGMALDGDATLFFQLHIVKHLILHIALRHGVGDFQQSVCQRAFAVVNVGNDTEITDVLQVQWV